MAYCHVLNSGIDWTCWCFTFCILGFNLCCYICPQHSIFFASYILSSLLCASPWGFHHILCSLFHFTIFFQFALHCTPLSLVCSFSILHQSLFLLWPPTFCCYCCLIPHCFFVCALHFSFVSGTLLSSFFHFALCSSCMLQSPVSSWVQKLVIWLPYHHNRLALGLTLHEWTCRNASSFAMQILYTMYSTCATDPAV